MEKSVGEDPSLALRMTRRTGSGWQGIPGRAGNDGDENWNAGERAVEMMGREQRESRRGSRERRVEREREDRMKAG